MSITKLSPKWARPSRFRKAKSSRSVSRRPSTLNLQLATPSSSSSATNFQQILEQFGLTQHMSVPTHKGGGWLDVVITRDDCTPTVDVWPPVLSDHGLVVANLPFLHETRLRFEADPRMEAPAQASIFDIVIVSSCIL